MGRIRNRIIKAVLPPGTVTMTEQQVAGLAPQSGARAEPLPRDPNLANIPFPPAMPLIPALINTPRSDGRADPRRYEFPVAWNLQLVEQRNIPFRTLREVADTADIVRKCIEVVKGAITGQDWDIVVSDDTIAHVMAEQGVSAVKAAEIMRDRYRDDIARAKEFWKAPDRMNGMNFPEWISMLLEEVLVIDALSIYPNRTVDSKNLWSLEILDGATIKPLLDARGSRPLPPQPAFQQILWGFPRGEFTAAPDSDGEFTADDLVYAPRTRRPFTPYGFSPVERCLPLVDLYLKRLHWYRTEFTDGVMPDLFMKSDMEFGSNPELIRGYEQVFNDALSGNLEARRRLRLLPNGFEPVIPRIAESKYSNLFDEYLVKSISGHFGVLPSQLGFTPQSGLGGAGHQEGEANSAETLGLKPLNVWLIDLLNQLQQRFLGIPADLTFVLSDGTEDDQRMMAQRRQMEFFSGQKTLNEVRTEMGMPLFDFAEADAPMVIQGRSVVPIAAAFESVAINASGQEGPRPATTPADPEAPGKPAAGEVGPVKPNDSFPPAAKAELASFVRWAKTEKNRDFEFEHLNPGESALLNDLVKSDAAAARHLASLWKAGGGGPKVGSREDFPRNHPARPMAEKLFHLYTRRIGSVGPDLTGLVDAWFEDHQTDAKVWLRDRHADVIGKHELATILEDLYAESGWMGTVATKWMLLHGMMPVDDEPSVWGGWEPGDPDKARMLFPSGRNLVPDVQDIVDGINLTRLTTIAAILSGATDPEQALADVADAQTDAGKAEQIAWTELNRANTEAVLDELLAAGVGLVDWVTSGQGNSCDECLELEADSPHDLADLVDQPPLHPNCGCQLVPANITGEKAAVAELVKVRRAAVDRALAELSGIPDATGGHIRVPWPTATRPKIGTDRWENSTLKAFGIESLTATQDYLSRDTVVEHIKAFGKELEPRYSNPNVVYDGGVYKIYDGHHRLAALWLLGADMANCWMLETE